jgi:hypothetical protein
MKIDHLPGHVPAHARGITPDNTTTGDAPAPTGDADGADSGGFDDAVAVELSETAQQFSGPGNSVAHQARAALAANIAGDSGVPFGHIVRQIAQGHDFFAAAAAAAAEEAGEGDSTEAVAPTTDETTGETTGETAETSAPPAEETPVVADGDLAIDLGVGDGDAADPDLALLEQLIEDLANDDETIV